MIKIFNDSSCFKSDEIAAITKNNIDDIDNMSRQKNFLYDVRYYPLINKFQHPHGGYAGIIKASYTTE
ncbi:hypothetical protein BGX38DRAFT_217062 [Terfezia claveryi]|nr:hypothetical protein BGX38DRAFT_217062 [Terfezia claveryi]